MDFQECTGTEPLCSNCSGSHGQRNTVAKEAYNLLSLSVCVCVCVCVCLSEREKEREKERERERERECQGNSLWGTPTIVFVSGMSEPQADLTHTDTHTQAQMHT